MYNNKKYDVYCIICIYIYISTIDNSIWNYLEVSIVMGVPQELDNLSCFGSKSSRITQIDDLGVPQL